MILLRLCPTAHKPFPRGVQSGSVSNIGKMPILVTPLSPIYNTTNRFLEFLNLRKKFGETHCNQNRHFQSWSGFDPPPARCRDPLRKHSRPARFPLSLCAGLCARSVPRRPRRICNYSSPPYEITCTRFQGSSRVSDAVKSPLLAERARLLTGDHPGHSAVRQRPACRRGSWLILESLARCLLVIELAREDFRERLTRFAIRTT